MPNTAKAEAIRKAWGVHYAEDIDENGWRESNVGRSGWDKEYFDIMKKDENVYLIRPKMLNGIVTNNGWIRIDSEENLPKDSFNYYAFCSNGSVMTFNDFEYYKKYIIPELKVTHYQPIVKPEKPIY